MLPFGSLLFYIISAFLYYHGVYIRLKVIKTDWVIVELFALGPYFNIRLAGDPRDRACGNGVDLGLLRAARGGEMLLCMINAVPCRAK